MAISPLVRNLLSKLEHVCNQRYRQYQNSGFLLNEMTSSTF